MEDTLLMRCVTYDSVALSGKTQYLFFNDDDDSMGERANSVVEAEIVRWIFQQQSSVGYLFFDELEISRECHVFLEVRDPVIKDRAVPGDIDIILLDPARPDRAIAFQVKRIKGSVNEDNVMMLNTSSIAKGISQSKYMWEKYRFHQNYLMLLVVCDTQKRSANDQMFRYATLDEKQVIYRHAGLGDLPEEVGIFTYEINQPSGNSTDTTGVLLSKKLRSARVVDQMDDTTERIIRMLAK